MTAYFPVSVYLSDLTFKKCRLRNVKTISGIFLTLQNIFMDKILSIKHQRGFFYVFWEMWSNKLRQDIFSPAFKVSSLTSKSDLCVSVSWNIFLHKIVFTLEFYWDFRGQIDFICCHFMLTRSMLAFIIEYL